MARKERHEKDTTRILGEQLNDALKKKARHERPSKHQLDFFCGPQQALTDTVSQHVATVVSLFFEQSVVSQFCRAGRFCTCPLGETTCARGRSEGFLDLDRAAFMAQGQVPFSRARTCTRQRIVHHLCTDFLPLKKSHHCLGCWRARNGSEKEALLQDTKTMF